MIKHNLLIFVSGLLLGALLGVFWQYLVLKKPASISRSSNLASKKDMYSREFRKMVALGESTTAGGWSTTPERCWVSLLAGLINDIQSDPMEYINSGIGSNVISDKSPAYEYSGKPAANMRLDKHVIAHNPDLLIISYGLNDARGETSLGLFKKELKQLIRHVREHIDPVILLLGPYYMTYFEKSPPNWNHADLNLFRRYNTLIRDVALAENCLFADVIAANGETDWLVHHDGIHQNDLGHRIIANQIFEVLAQRCSGLAENTKEIEKTSPRWRDESALKAEYGY